MDTMARHLFIIPPTPQATWPVQLRGRQRHKLPLGAVSTRQRLDMMNEGLQEQARDSRREIPVACDAMMYEQYVILYYIVGPTCRGPNSHVRASLEILKGGARCALQEKNGHTTHKPSRTLSRQGNTTHSGRRVLCSGGPNHSKSCCVHRVLE